MAERIAVDDETQGQAVGPMIEAVTMTLREMLSVEAHVQGVYGLKGYEALGDLAAVMNLHSGLHDALILALPAATAAALAGRMLAEVPGTPDEEMILDCAGELVNVIAGQTKALLHGTPFQLSFTTPRVLAGDAGELGGEAGHLVVAFGSEVGEFALLLRGRPKNCS